MVLSTLEGRRSTHHPHCFLLFLPGVDYLEFLDLDANSEEVLPDSIGMNSSDYFSSTIYIENGIPIGATGELSTTLYVRVY